MTTRTRTLAVLTAGILALSLSACTGDDDASPTSSTSQTASATSATTTTTSTTVAPTTEPTVETPVAEPGAEAGPAAAPYVTECLQGTPGPAMWSDGTVAYSEDCFQQNGGAEYLEQESQGTTPFANGGTCPAYLCGYGTDENGNQNPSSGELQLQHGCEQGYINDPSRCAAVGVPITGQ
jgi:hypothetical protein